MSASSLDARRDCVARIANCLSAYLKVPPSERFLLQVDALVEDRMRDLREGPEAFERRFFRLAPSATIGEAAELARQIIPKVTRFFRYPEHFQALGRVCLQMYAQGQRSLSIWSAGCATGEEPYSVAMVVREHVPAAECCVLATDIDEVALARGRAGRYGGASLNCLDRSRINRWTTQVEAGGEREIDPQTRALVRFNRHSLASWPYPRTARGDSWDVIFCRNVLIYLEPEVQREAVARLHEALRPGGVLFLGPAEGLLVHGLAIGASPLVLEQSGDALFFRKRMAEPEPMRPKATPRPKADQAEADFERLKTARLDRAVMLADRGEWDEALVDVQQVLNVAPRSAEAHLLRGIVLSRQGQTERAEEALLRSVQLGHRSALAPFELGCLLAERNPAEAQRQFEIALEIAGKNGAEALMTGGLSVSAPDLAAACQAKLNSLGVETSQAKGETS